MCTQSPPHDFSPQLHGRFIELCDDFVTAHALPALRAAARAGGEPLLRELTARWDRHGVMVKWLCRFFKYLDSYFVIRHQLASLQDTGVHSFRNGIRREPDLERAIADAAAALAGGEGADAELAARVAEVMKELGLPAADAASGDAEPGAAAAE